MIRAKKAMKNKSEEVTEWLRVRGFAHVYTSGKADGEQGLRVILERHGSPHSLFIAEDVHVPMKTVLRGKIAVKAYLKAAVRSTAQKAVEMAELTLEFHRKQLKTCADFLD